MSRLFLHVLGLRAKKARVVRAVECGGCSASRYFSLNSYPFPRMQALNMLARPVAFMSLV